MKDYLAPSVPGLEPLCLRCGLEEVVGACAVGLDSGLGLLTFRASLPPLMTGALFTVSGFFSTTLTGPCCDWADCCSPRRALLPGALVSADFLSPSAGAVLVCTCGTLGVGVAGADSLTAGRDGLRPRPWDWAATGGVVTEGDVVCACGTLAVGVAGADSLTTGRDGLRPRLWDWAVLGMAFAGGDPGCSDARFPVGVTTGACWGFTSVELTRPAAAIAARTSARKSTDGLLEPEGLAVAADSGGTTGVTLVSTTGRWNVVAGAGVVWTTGADVG